MPCNYPSYCSTCRIAGKGNICNKPGHVVKSAPTRWRAPKKNNLKAWKQITDGDIWWDQSAIDKKKKKQYQWRFENHQKVSRIRERNKALPRVLRTLFPNRKQRKLIEKERQKVAFCRAGIDSDLYIVPAMVDPETLQVNGWNSNALGYLCIHVKDVVEQGWPHSFTCISTDEILMHISEHSEAGHKIPRNVIDKIIHDPRKFGVDNSHQS